MDINDIVSTDYATFSPETRVSKLAGTFDDPTVPGVIVYGDEFQGVVTRRGLATSHHQPDEKLGSLARPVPRVRPDEDLRRVAALMLDGDSMILPAFEGNDLVGVVTADDLLRAVEGFLDAATVADVYSGDLVTVGPGATLGEALNLLREHRITHLPVVEDGTTAGILSLYDLVGLTVRATSRSQGGDPGGVDAHGGPVFDSAGRSRGGGFGAREGETDRLLDLPVRDAMSSPVRTVDPGETLDVAVREMFAIDASSVVVTVDDRPDGIVTKTDLLDALTWETDDTRAVQLYGADLLDDATYEDVVAMVDRFDGRDGRMTVLDARIHLHEHRETMRGSPLLLARIRIHTDRGLYIATGEGYGASHALNEARDALERQILDDKTRARWKNHPSEEFWEARFGWRIEE